MATADLVRSLPAIVGTAVLPGFAVAGALVRWPWWQRLAAAPGLSIGLIGIIGLAEHDLGIPFLPLSVLPPLALATVLASVLARRRGSAPAVTEFPLDRRRATWVIAAALGAGVLSAGALVAELHVSPLPYAIDTPVHAFVAEKAAVTHDVFPVEHVPATGGSSVRPRPAFEVTAVVVSWLGGPRPALSLYPLATVVVVLLPLSLAMLAVEVGAGWRVAALAPWLGVGMPFPRFPLVYGELPYLADSTLVVPLVVAAAHALRGRERGRHAAVVGAAVASVWVTHGLEALTATVVAAPLVAGLALGNVRRAMVALALLALAAAVAAAGVTALTRLPPTAPGHLPPGVHVAASQAPYYLGLLGRRQDVGEVFSAFAAGDLGTAISVPLFAAGLAAAIVGRRLLWAVVVWLLFLLCLADVGYTTVLSPLWTAVFPWAVVDRLLAMPYWVVPLIMAYGVVWTGDLVARLAPRVAGSVAPGLPLAAAPNVVAIGAVLITAGSGVLDDRHFYADMRAFRAPVTGADVAALAALDSALPPGSVVLTDPSRDAGTWVDALTRDSEYAPDAWAQLIVDSRNQLVARDPRATALDHACSHPGEAVAALEGVDAVFVGSRRAANATSWWNTRCLAHLPGLHPLVTVGEPGATATVYGVDHRLAGKAVPRAP